MTKTTYLRRAPLLLFVAIHIGSTRASADVAFYTSEAAFDAASTGLATQTFASAVIASSGESIIANPLNSATNNGVFATGSILPGLSFSSSAEHASMDIGVVAPGLFGDTNKSIFNNFGGDSLVTTFTTARTAVGMGLLNPDGTSVSFVVQSPAGQQIGTSTVTVNSAGAPVFFGVVATNGSTIGAITLLGQPTSGGTTHDFAGVDRVVFGSAVVVPEPAGLALMGIGAGLSLVARRLFGRVGSRMRSRA